MANTPSFVAAPANFMAFSNTANANRDGSGTITDITTAAPTSGLRIDDLTLAATGTTTAGTVRLYVHNGTVWRCLRDIQVPAITPSASVASFQTVFTNMALVLQSGWKLGFAPHNAEGFNVIVTRGGTF